MLDQQKCQPLAGGFGMVLAPDQDIRKPRLLAPMTLLLRPVESDLAKGTLGCIIGTAIQAPGQCQNDCLCNVWKQIAKAE